MVNEFRSAAALTQTATVQKSDFARIANNEFPDITAENYAKMQEELITLKAKLDLIK